MDKLTFFLLVNEVLVLEILEQKCPEKNRQLLELIMKLNLDLMTLQVADSVKPTNPQRVLAVERLVNHENWFGNAIMEFFFCDGIFFLLKCLHRWKIIHKFVHQFT